MKEDLVKLYARVEHKSPDISKSAQVMVDKVVAELNADKATKADRAAKEAEWDCGWTPVSEQL